MNGQLGLSSLSNLSGLSTLSGSDVYHKSMAGYQHISGKWIRFRVSGERSTLEFPFLLPDALVFGYTANWCADVLRHASFRFMQLS